MCSCMPALASSGTAPASSGEVVKFSRELRRSWILGHNGFLWSCKVKIYILGVFGALCQFRRILPELAGAGYAITSNRLTGQVLVSGRECCLGGAGHLVVPLFGVGGTPRGISFLPPKLMKNNFKARKKKALWAPCTPDKGASKCPAPPKKHSGPFFGPASVRKMW